MPLVRSLPQFPFHLPLTRGFPQNMESQFQKGQDLPQDKLETYTFGTVLICFDKETVTTVKRFPNIPNNMAIDNTTVSSIRNHCSPPTELCSSVCVLAMLVCSANVQKYNSIGLCHKFHILLLPLWVNMCRWLFSYNTFLSLLMFLHFGISCMHHFYLKLIRNFKIKVSDRRLYEKIGTWLRKQRSSETQLNVI